MCAMSRLRTTWPRHHLIASRSAAVLLATSSCSRLVVLQLTGAALLVALTRVTWRSALERPSSLFFSLIALYVASLGWAGLPLAAVLLVITRLGLTPLPDATPLRRGEVLSFLALSCLVLARPWTPTQWDEFVWIAKARLESLGFGAGVRAALDPSSGVIPAGYPPLWPSAIGWLSLHVDDIEADVLSGSLLMLACVATLVEVWRAREAQAAGRFALVILFSSPLIWVHLRSTYVDLPVGLLSASLALCLTGSARPPFLAVLLAVALAGFKDEGLLHVLAATGAALTVHGVRAWRSLLPMLAAVVASATWKVLLACSSR